MKRSVILFSIISLCCFALFNMQANAQTMKNQEQTHSIDIEEQKCIQNSNIYNYPLCSRKAEKAWDEEISKNLKLLKESLPKEEYKYITKMNEKWEKSVKAQIAVINKFISGKDGIIYQTAGSSHISDLKKEYALFLKAVYTNYTE